MDKANQNHWGAGDNVAGNKIVYNSPPATSRSEYLNTFAHYDLANLVGRKPRLKAIDQHLKQHHLLLLHGIGGIGKTTLAKAYISQAHHQYDHIAYVEIVGSIAASMVSQLGNSPDVGGEIDPALDPEAKFISLIDILRHIPKLLLVLDNANDADELGQRKRQLTSLNATVLITGRARPQSFVQERNMQEIKALTPDEALRLFSNHYTSALTESDRALVERMLQGAFYHPKLVEVIAKSAQANAFLNLEELNQLVGKKHYQDEEINFPIEIDDQTKKIYRVLLDLFNTDDLSEDTKQVLRYFAILPTIDSPVQDLATLLQAESTEERQAIAGNLNSLVHTGWLEALDNRSFSMHGLVQWVIRQRLKPTANNCQPLISGMATALSYEPTESPLGKQRYLPYTVEWLTLFTDDQDEELANTFSWIAATYGALGDQQQALTYNQKALAILEAVLPPTHPDLALSYNNLAATYGALGDQQQALTYHQKALAIWEAVLPPTHPSLAQSYNNLAITYYYLEDFKMAFDYMLKATTIKRRILPPTHPDLIDSEKSLAIIEQELQNRTTRD